MEGRTWPSRSAYISSIGIFILFHLNGYTLGDVYTTTDSSCANTKNISDWAFVHTQNADFGSSFVPERCCAASVLKVNRHISDFVFVTLP